MTQPLHKVPHNGRGIQLSRVSNCLSSSRYSSISTPTHFSCESSVSSTIAIIGPMGPHRPTQSDNCDPPRRQQPDSRVGCWTILGEEFDESYSLIGTAPRPRLYHGLISPGMGPISMTRIINSWHRPTLLIFYRHPSVNHSTFLPRSIQ